MHKAAILCSLLYAAPVWAQQEEPQESTTTEATEAIAEEHEATAAAEAEAAAEAPTAVAPAAVEPAKEVAPVPAPTVAPAPPTAPPMDPKLAGLTLGGQVIFAAALQAKSLTDAEKAWLAGAFSTAQGDWLAPEGVRPDLLKAFADAVEPLAEVDPQDATAVRGKTTELVKAVDAASALAEASARPVLRADVLAGLQVFKTALKPPYAHGQSRRKIYGWTLAGFGGLVTLTGGTALINPNEPSRLGFATTATTAGILLAGAGAAMVLLDDSP